jgi:hypothetical protein
MVASRPDRPRGGGSAHSLHICPKGSGGRYTERIGWTARSGVLIERAHDRVRAENRDTAFDKRVCGQPTDLAITVRPPHSMIAAVVFSRT